MKRLGKKVLGMLACAVLTMQLFLLCAGAESSALSIADGFEMICENQKLALYLNADNCFFAVGDKSTGKVLYSNPLNAEEDKTASNRYKMELLAQFAFEYRKTDGKKPDYLNSYTASVRRGEFTVKKESNGFTIFYKLANQGLTLPLKVELCEEYMDVSVDLTGLKGMETQLNSIMLLPYFGSGDIQTAGYNFVPDGSGALIHYNNKKTGAGGYKQWVYGNDPADEDTDGTFIGEKVSVPVFGSDSEKGSFLGVIEDGAPQSAIQAFTSGNLTMFNNVYPSFALIPSNTLTVNEKVQNDIFGAEYLTDSVSVRYYPLGADRGGYVGMADTYREYLLENNKLNGRKQADSYGMLLETYGAVRKKESIIGFPVTVTKKLTSFEDCLSMVKAMEEKGVATINVKYNNWSKAGITNKIDDDPRPMGQIGGERGHKALNDYLERVGGKAFLNVSAMTFENSSSGASANYDAIKKLGNIKVEESPIKRNTLVADTSKKNRLFLNPLKVHSVLGGLFPNMAKWGNRSIGFSDIGSLAYSDFSDKQTVFRNQSIDKVNELVLSNQSAYDSLLLNNSNAYSFGYADYISNLPTESSGFTMTDESVPFLQLVLHGSVKYAAPPINRSSNPRISVLKAIETGSELSFAWIYEKPEILQNTSLSDLYAADYRLWQDYAAESYKMAGGILKDVSGQRITDHRSLAEGVYETVYENGTRTIVNYNDEAVTTQDGVTVNALDAAVVRGGA